MRTFSEFLDSQLKAQNAGLSDVFDALTTAGKEINAAINIAGLADISGALDSNNSHGEQQQKLDMVANDAFKAALVACGEVAGLASEEEDSFVNFDAPAANGAEYVVMIDPLDGSSNIDVCVPVGTIFAIYRRISPSGEPVQMADFLQPGSQQVGAGYILFGSSTMLVYSVGEGVHGFTFDPSKNEFYLSHESMSISEDGKIYAINESSSNHYSEAIQAFIESYKNPIDAQPYTARYIGSLVADFHRSLIKGGVFSYPESVLHPNGKLRLLYECNPIAYLGENAGGKSITTLGERVLDIPAQELHQRIPFVVGSAKMVERLESILA
jgi:fructose-1,6-bisphosphatase I